MQLLCRIETAARRLADSIDRALKERATGFSDYEAGDFLSDLGVWHSDGGPTEWLAPQTPASPAGEQPAGAGQPPRSGAGVAAPGGGRAGEWDTSILLSAAAHLLATLTGPQPIVGPVEFDTRRRLRCEYANELIAELRDRAAQFEAVSD